MQLSWWCDELQDWTLEQAVWGLRRWNREHPRLRPTPGDIVGILMAERGRQKAAEVAAMTAQPQQDRKPASAEAVAAILRENRMGVNTFGRDTMTPEQEAAERARWKAIAENGDAA